MVEIASPVLRRVLRPPAVANEMPIVRVAVASVTCVCPVSIASKTAMKRVRPTRETVEAVATRNVQSEASAVTVKIVLHPTAIPRVKHPLRQCIAATVHSIQIGEKQMKASRTTSVCIFFVNVDLTFFTGPLFFDKLTLFLHLPFADCGGQRCAANGTACAVGKKCLEGRDCTSGLCTYKLAAVAVATDRTVMPVLSIF